jgi:hypothetical protein
MAALFLRLSPTDAVTLLDVAPSDLAKLAQILQPVEVHVDVDQLPRNQLPADLVARLDAELKLGHAEQAVVQAGGRKLADWETNPQTLLQIGHRLYNTGGHANYVRAAALAEMLQYAYWGATLVHDSTAPTVKSVLQKERGLRMLWPQATPVRVKVSGVVRVLWRRAPLLVLLLTWLAIGIFGGSLVSSFNFEFWAIGFLALVGFGFYSRIRN